MKTVILIGAGSSRAEAKSQNATKDRRPPLDTDFFPLARLHGLEPHRLKVETFAREHFGIETFRHPPPRMEELFGLIFSSTSGSLSPPGAKDAFSSLFRIYTTVIAETTNWLTPTRKGPLCRLLHGALVDGPTTVITFNQDILVEKALQVLTAAASPATWYPDTGYAMKFAHFTYPRGSEETFPLSPSKQTAQPEVLKPHGSLNWYARTSVKGRVPAQLPQTQTVFCTTRLQITTDMTTSTRRPGRGRKTWYTWPIVIPPIIEKGSFLGRALDSVWSRAWEVLLAADRVIIYGYSFPEADAQGRAFFLRASAQMPSRPLLATINPDFGSAAKAAVIFRPRALLHCESVRAFLKESEAFKLTS